MKKYRLTLASSTSSSTVEGEATPPTSADGKDRVVWSCDDTGRGASLEIKPLSADTQFIFHGVRLYVVPSKAGPEDA